MNVDYIVQTIPKVAAGASSVSSDERAVAGCRPC